MENQLSQLKIHRKEEKKEYGMVSLLEKKPRNTDGAAVTVETNVRKIGIPPNTPIFKYLVVIKYVYQHPDGTREVFVEVSKSTMKGTAHENDKSRCQKVYKLAVRQFEELQKSGPFFYDRQASLFSLSELKDENKLSFSFTGPQVSKRSNFLRAEFYVSKVADSFQTTSNDLGRSFDSRPRMVDRTLFEALSVIISAPAFENAGVVTIGNCVHYLYDHANTGIRELSFAEGGRYAAVGTAKSIKTLQGGPDGDKNAALFIVNELKTTLFHPDHVPLTELFATFNGFNTNLKANHPAAVRILKAVLGAECWMDYGESAVSSEDAKVVRIRGFGNSANEEIFDIEAKKTTVTEYFKTKYQIRLEYPHLFTILAKGRDGRKLSIPAECLRICANQTVRNEQFIGKEQADLIKLSAVRPNERKFATDVVVAEVGISAQTIHNFVNIGAPEKVSGIVLPKPAIVFAGGKTVNWNDPNKRSVATDFTAPGFYFMPAKLTNWEVVFVKGDLLPEVIRPLLNEMKSSGMTVAEPVVTQISGAIEPIFVAAKKAQRQLLFFITRTDYHFHQEIKVLEQQFDLLTQDLKYETAEKLLRQPQTRKNVVNKTNMKLGGLNFLVNSAALASRRRLIVGFETSSRNAGPDAPICIGYSANMLKHPHQFSGGYVFAKKEGDVYGSILTKTMVQILQTVCAKRETPDEIFVYFSGVTEGQYGLINESYLEAIKTACLMKKDPKFRPCITIITASKAHNERLYQSSQNGVFNLEPGTVVDHTIVSPVYNEFYLASAVARQGTLKPAKFTVICSAAKDITMKNIEEMTNDLCYEHQIVFQPVSLPIPLYLAGRNSERGSANLSFKGAVMKDGVLDLEATNDRFSYKNKNLFYTRFNA